MNRSTLSRGEVRLLAAVVAVALSGAPRLAAALRPEADHVCECRAHGAGHVCACPVCKERLRQARRGAVEALPPCHRGAALAGLDDEEERERRAATLPSLLPVCGRGEAQALLPGAEAMALSAAPGLPRDGGCRAVAPRAAHACELPSAPDVPPPKRA